MSHVLDKNDAWFVDLNRKDALTLSGFQYGDEVVVCAKCKNVSLKISWYADSSSGRCCVCGGTEQSVFSRKNVWQKRRGRKLVFKKKRVSPLHRVWAHAYSEQTGKRLLGIAALMVAAFLAFMGAYVFFFGGMDTINNIFPSFWRGRIKYLDLNITRKLAAFDVSAPVRKWGVLWNSIVRKTGECIDHIFHPFG